MKVFKDTIFINTHTHIILIFLGSSLPMFPTAHLTFHLESHQNLNHILSRPELITLPHNLASCRHSTLHEGSLISGGTQTKRESHH